VTPLYPQKLALISPTGGGRSVGIVRSRTKATEFLVFFTALLTLRDGKHKIQLGLYVESIPTLLADGVTPRINHNRF